VHVLEPDVDVGVLVGERADGADALALGDVVIGIVETGDPQSAEDRRPFGERAQAAADHDRLLVVHLGAVVVLAVVDTDVDVAVVRTELVAVRHARIGGREEPDALGEQRALEAIAVDALQEVEIRGLLNTEAGV